MVQYFNTLLIVMSALAAAVFVALFFVNAGYGRFYSKSWGRSIPNRWGWFFMEFPVVVAMMLLWLLSDRAHDSTRVVLLLPFLIHYFQRSFIFPFLMRGSSRMALSVVALGVVFNVINAIMQGGWIFYVSPVHRYTPAWLTSPQFIVGSAIFITGFIINLHSDYIIRHLRSKNDTNHYLPTRGLFKYVTSANYFGELVEWSGFAILTWSLPGLVFVWWTFANLAPRAAKLYENYKVEFGDQFDCTKVKRLIPFVY